MKAKRSLLLVALLLVFNLAFTVGNSESPPELRPALTERRLRITLNDTDVVYAKMADSHAAELFAQNLPFTINMDDYINRNKRGSLPFVIGEEDQKNIIYPFELGDIIYYPPGPLLGIFYDHNGAEISAGYELVAQMDAEGIEIFKSYPGDVTVTVELDEPSAEAAPELRPALSERRLMITLNNTDVVYAKIADSHAAELFAQNLPFTIDMDDYINRNKRGPLPFVIGEEDQQNIIYPFELGDIIYYPPGPLLGIFYDHNGAEISAGYELVAQMDTEGIEIFKSYPGDVTVTVALSE